ncbi:MAG TPA: helix-turn-helix transcriptional regulator [Puia sp.]|jgi:AraC-like DNA-binding protein|nr:helix-turn-helix transcriptional regulator [Puia sp.]
MEAVETIQQFYARTQADAINTPLNNAGSGHFNVFSRETCNGTPYGRRDFYKVTLIIGKGRLHYADQWLEVDRPALLISNPRVPYSWERFSEQAGWYCLFTEAFLHPDGRQDLPESMLFPANGVPVFFVDERQQREIGEIFMRMKEEMASDYGGKFDLLRHYLHVILHYAMKMQPAGRLEQPVSAAGRLTHAFLELLERQYPIDTTETELQLRTANDFAEKLAVHVNHLNRALKEVTGKTTTEHISARVIKEALALLRHSDWNISQIAYGLGFEYPAYFNIFFKKHTGLTPLEARGAPSRVAAGADAQPTNHTDAQPTRLV